MIIYTNIMLFVELINKFNLCQIFSYRNDLETLTILEHILQIISFCKRFQAKRKKMFFTEIAVQQTKNKEKEV